MRVIVRLTSPRVPPYVMTGVSEADTHALVEEWRWGTARIISIPVDDVAVHVARREILSLEVGDDHKEAS
jgi:hypothetical protein